MTGGTQKAWFGCAAGSLVLGLLALGMWCWGTSTRKIVKVEEPVPGIREAQNSRSSSSPYKGNTHFPGSEEAGLSEHSMQLSMIATRSDTVNGAVHVGGYTGFSTQFISEGPSRTRGTLHSHLQQSFPLVDTLDRGRLNSLRNDALGALLRSGDNLEGVGYEMLEMYRSETEDPQWQNYLVQHYAPFYAARQRQLAGAEDAEMRRVKEALWNAADDPDGSIAGSALIGLEELSGEQNTVVDRNRLNRTAQRIVMGDGYPQSARVTAIQILAKTNNEDSTARLARGVIESAPGAHLQIAALAALGATGTESDLRYLNTIATDAEDAWVRNAAISAQSRILRRSESVSPPN